MVDCVVIHAIVDECLVCSRYALRNVSLKCMCEVFVLASIIGVALAAPQNYYTQPQPQYQDQYSKNVVPIISETNEVNPDGSYSYSYETGDGQQAQAQGYLKNAGAKDAEAEVAQGSYSYRAPDGTPIQVTAKELFTENESNTDNDVAFEIVIKEIALVCLLSTCYAARLDNTYLPPGGAGAGGSGLPAPFPGRPNGNGGRPGSGPSFGNGNGNGGGTAPGGGNGGPGGAQIPIISYENENNGDGSYRFSYETGNGIKAQEEGFLKNAGSESEAQSAAGSFSYTAPDGQKIELTYTADENGFQPQGAHLPTPPPIPEAILRSLEQNAGGSGPDSNGYPGQGGNGGGGQQNGYRY
ncbi:cuticle protein [Holotrichia oblita]|uniref:Cuticle protein n=1 Tax=Holotrichia oblita TaxID=644536 RepID=A0ACB9TFY6_HOLOL|nr:cuticle protein [Holotrichia oblita]